MGQEYKIKNSIKFISILFLVVIIPNSSCKEKNEYQLNSIVVMYNGLNYDDPFFIDTIIKYEILEVKDCSIKVQKNAIKRVDSLWNIWPMYQPHLLFIDDNGVTRMDVAILYNFLSITYDSPYKLLIKSDPRPISMFENGWIKVISEKECPLFKVKT